MSGQTHGFASKNLTQNLYLTGMVRMYRIKASMPGFRVLS
jgi:hypothetical protein